MEALFSTQMAVYEAWIMLLCVGVFIGIYMFDGVHWIKRVIEVLTPRPPTPPVPLLSDEPVEIVSPMLAEITPAEIEEHEGEKEARAIEEEEQVTRLDEEEAKMIEEAETKIGDEEAKTENIDEDEAEQIIEEATPEPEAMEEAVEDLFEEATIKESTPYTTETMDAPAEEEVIAEHEEQTIEEATVVPEQAIQEEDTNQKITGSTPEPIIEPTKEKPAEHTAKKEGVVERLYLIVNEVKTLIARGQTQDARMLIIEGLSLDKYHRELNLILGSLYESERQSQKAEYVYKDLALSYPDDVEILEKLANILIIEKRYDIAMEIYKKIVSLSGETEGSLYIMSHLARETGHQEEMYAYTRRYQKNWPNNPEILSLLAEAEIALGERQAAIQTLIKLKNLTPYNSEIMDMIAKLTTEEELAGNFGG